MQDQNAEGYGAAGIVEEYLSKGKLNEKEKEHLRDAILYAKGYISDKKIEEAENKLNQGNKIMAEEKMSLRDFRKKYHKVSKNWDFEKFKIRCVKCRSEKVEFNGQIELDYGYYENDCSLDGKIIIKCHECGNAHEMSAYDLEK